METATEARKQDKFIPRSKLTLKMLHEIAWRRQQVKRRFKPLVDTTSMTRAEIISFIETMAPKERIRKARMPKNTGVGRYCQALLAKVISNGPDGPIGLSYNKMVKMIAKKFPESAADERHLRWYAAKMRRDDIRIPVERERSKWL